jgi:hypothetical protein
MASSDDFRKNAGECRLFASKALSPEEKAQWLKLADEWTRMADAARALPDGFDAK